MGAGVLSPAAADVFRFRDDRLFCEGVAAERIVARHGTPLYVYSRSAIRARYGELRDAFAPLDPLIAYSVKANGNLSILRLLAREGAGADIVSGGELHRALLAGVPADRIVFSGVGKTVAEMAAALRAGIYGFNVESESELRMLSELACAMETTAPVALRINPAIESPTPHVYTRTGHAESKFGIPYEDAERLYRLAAELPGIRVRGIDVHIGSQILDPEPYRLAAEQVLTLVDALERRGIELEYIDLGGGFGVTYGSTGDVTSADFADALVPAFEGRSFRIVLEPGRFVVGPAGLLLTRILYVKRMAGTTFVIADAGMNDLLRPSHYSSTHVVDSARQHPEREILNVDIVGPICESGDFLALDHPIQRPESGELLSIRTAGAYGFSMASTYNSRPRPAEVLVDGDDFRLVRRRETYEDLVRGEVELLE